MLFTFARIEKLVSSSLSFLAPISSPLTLLRLLIEVSHCP